MALVPGAAVRARPGQGEFGALFHDRLRYVVSYGGGVNSTALAVLILSGRLPLREVAFVFSDTGEEKDETYAYIRDYFRPWLEARGHLLFTVAPSETVLQRWERLSVTGSRLLRSCTVEAKIRPIERFIKQRYQGGADVVQVIGIDAGEAHRAKPSTDKIYPLVDMNIDREDCEEIITAAGLPVPPKSGCWHCPFSRVGDVLALVRDHPVRFDRIERLEHRVLEVHGRAFYQFRDKPAAYWRERAKQEGAPEPERETPMPCECYAG